MNINAHGNSSGDRLGQPRLPDEIILGEPISLTVHDPDPLPTLLLQFRDLQTLWFLFRSYSLAQINTTESEHARCDRGALDHQASHTSGDRDAQTIARIMLSAFLSAYTTLFYYFGQAIMSKDGHKWLAKQIDKKALLAAFERLRNRNTHHESLNGIVGSRFLVDRISRYPTRDNAEVSHVHWGSTHQGVGFCIDKLQETNQFANRCDLVELLTDKPIIELAHDCIHEISEVLNCAVALRHITSDRAFMCWICRPSVASRGPLKSQW